MQQNNQDLKIDEKTGAFLVLFLLFTVVAYNTIWDINNPPSIQESITVISIVFGVPYVIYLALKDPQRRAIVATYLPKVVLGFAKMFYHFLKASYLLAKFTFRQSRLLIHAIQQRRGVR